MKSLKVFCIAVMVCVVLVVSGFLILLGIMNNQNESYRKYAETNGEIKTRYTAPGTYEVSTAEWNADSKAWQNYEVWYPAELKKGNGTFERIKPASVTSLFTAFHSHSIGEGSPSRKLGASSVQCCTIPFFSNPCR